MADPITMTKVCEEHVFWFRKIRLSEFRPEDGSHSQFEARVHLRMVRRGLEFLLVEPEEKLPEGVMVAEYDCPVVLLEATTLPDALAEVAAKIPGLKESAVADVRKAMSPIIVPDAGSPANPFPKPGGNGKMPMGR
jgi:hypothetical protein